MAIAVDPYLQKIPSKIQQDPELKAYFEFLERYLRDLWVRTGGGQDNIAQGKTDRSGIRAELSSIASGLNQAIQSLGNSTDAQINALTTQLSSYAVGLNKLSEDAISVSEISSISTKLSSQVAGLNQIIGEVSKLLNAKIEGVDSQLSSYASGLRQRIRLLEADIFDITSDHTTTNNEILVLKNTTPITITLNTNPSDGEFVEMLKETDPIVTIVGTINGTTPTDFIFAGDGIKIRYTRAAGEWSLI